MERFHSHEEAQSVKPMNKEQILYEITATRQLIPEQERMLTYKGCRESGEKTAFGMRRLKSCFNR